MQQTSRWYPDELNINYNVYIVLWLIMCYRASKRKSKSQKRYSTELIWCKTWNTKSFEPWINCQSTAECSLPNPIKAKSDSCTCDIRKSNQYWLAINLDGTKDVTVYLVLLTFVWTLLHWSIIKAFITSWSDDVVVFILPIFRQRLWLVRIKCEKTSKI